MWNINLAGDVGATGAAGVSGWERVSLTTANNTTSTKTQSVNCTAGKKLVGGGFSSNEELHISVSWSG